MTECQIVLSQQEFDDISKCEAVIVREYENDSGDRKGVVAAYGDESDMNEQCANNGFIVVPVGWEIVRQHVMSVSELLGR